MVTEFEVAAHLPATLTDPLEHLQENQKGNHPTLGTHNRSIIGLADLNSSMLIDRSQFRPLTEEPGRYIGVV